MQKRRDIYSGNAGGDELVPIDIHYNKLLDWLLDRRHCDIKWQGVVLEIRQKINAAIQDMPPVEEITQLLSGAYINYFHCVRIVELLKVSESSSKNIFGGYSSKRMKDWQEIIRLYERNNVNLAEASHLLIRNVNYEIPALKRQIAKCQLTQRECTRKENEYSSNAVSFKDKYQTVCKQMGIKGENIKCELLSLLDELPQLHESIAKAVSNLKSATCYYETFVNFLVPSSSTVTSSLIKHIEEHGNTTVYQWKTGNIPSVTVGDKRPGKPASESNGSNEEKIDWGEEANVDTNVDSIEWGDASNGMDWGESDEIIDWGDGQANTNDAGIDLVDDGLKTDQAGISDLDVISGPDGETVLDATKTRNLLLDELLELQAFLRQRLIEMKSDSDILSANQFQTAPNMIQMQSLESISSMEAAVTDVLTTLTSMKMHNLFLLKTSPRYLDRLVDSLQQKLKISEKMVSSRKIVVEKRQTAAEEQMNLEPKLDIIRSKTKELQWQVAEEISKKYKNRPVNIMGEINII
ncbi:CDK5 regulatory subunit-associated protein 3-like isoform X1 [Acropora muricata]